ncbi:hypothetical protein EEL32_00365 (plasmid) [Brevibacillus laterosporus]|nr:hypothetical protein [Brevibacillus laterosporus]TPG93542.1 hypothetical protein EEL32_00365 [Brevibacillus laterosporus]
MDIKTLEYMEKRAEAGRSIVKQIEKLQGRVVLVKGKSFSCIDIKVNSSEIRTTKWGSTQLPNDYSAEVEAKMINSYIDVTNIEIKRLEKELAEL